MLHLSSSVSSFLAASSRKSQWIVRERGNNKGREDDDENDDGTEEMMGAWGNRQTMKESRMVWRRHGGKGERRGGLRGREVERREETGGGRMR